MTQHRIEHADPEQLLQILLSLPKDHPIQLPVTIVSVCHIRGITAHFSDISLRLSDLTSMGLKQHAQIRPNTCVWLEGFWGETLPFPLPDSGHTMRVTAVHACVDPGEPLAIISLRGPLSLPGAT